MLNDYFRDPEYNICYSHNRETNPIPADFHLHNRLEIYFFISGNVNYFVEKKVYPLKHGDLLIMNSHEIHKASFQPGPPYERIVIHFEPSIIKVLCSSDFDLLNCFLNRPAGEQNKINLNKKQVDEIMQLFMKLENLKDFKGADILKLTYFIELLVFINQIFLSNLQPMEETHSVPDKLIPILDFIDRNLENDLSLEALEQKFYINRFYLSRLFKNVTGSTLHDYILFKRISRAKLLLSKGCNVTEACSKSGFRDYSNFLRMFKRTVGVSPGKYGK